MADDEEEVGEEENANNLGVSLVPLTILFKLNVYLYSILIF